MDKNLRLILSVVENSDGKGQIDVRFQRNGKDITYGDVTLAEKYNFAMCCQQSAGLIGGMVLVEQGIDPKTGEPFEK